MTPEDAPEFLGRLNALAELFDAKFSEVKQQMYFEALKDLDLCWVIEALNDAAKKCTFMPKPAELRVFAQGDPQEAAEQAWVDFKEAARQIGAYRDWMPDDPETAQAVIDVFGTWPKACETDFSAEMWASKRKEFIASYKRHYLKIQDVLRLSGIPSMWEKRRRPLEIVADVKELEAGHE